MHVYCRWVDAVSWMLSILTRRYVFFFFLLFLFLNFQPSVGAPLRMSLLVASCPRVTQLHMSTTCTVCGPSRQPLEARSGLNNTLFPPFSCLLVFWLHRSFPAILSIYHLSIYFQFSLAFCSGIHHCYRLLCNQSSASCYWLIVELLLGERKYPFKASRF